ncbi:dopamine D2-like receptor [Asterias rubens]|uniref:dopamine D2-like receptor n=1 Tax=Asterias rubens TaxID=7604 RepID=UPI001455C9E2|nr:dopamine D2-like receptor [Asterias rubens]
MGDNDTFVISGELPSVLATSIAAAITTVATVVGLVGNVLVIAAVARKKNLRTRGNTFIVSLSVVGLIYVSFVLIPGIDTLIRREWRLGDFACAFHTYYTLAFSLLSLLHTMCIGLDRVVNVVFFTRARRIASGRNIGIAIVLCWLVSLATMACYHFFVVGGKMLYLPKALRCIAMYNPQSWKVSISVYCFIFILPSIIIVASYVVILVFVRKKRKILMSNMTSRLVAPSKNMATSINSGETKTKPPANDRVTFAPTPPADRVYSSPTRRSTNSISVPVEQSAVCVTNADLPLTVSKDVQGGTGNADPCVADHQTPAPDADLPGQVNNKSSSATTIKVDFPLSDDEQNINKSKPPFVTSSNNGDEHSDGTHKCKTVSEEEEAVVADEFELKTTNQCQETSHVLEEHDVKTVPTDAGRKGRRGTIWSTASGRERFGDIAKTFGRARDRLRPSKKIRNDRDLNRMMLAVFTVVWIGYLPYPLVRYLDVPSINVSSNVYMVVTVSMYVAGCVNPIIYGFMHRRFKAAFIEMLTLGKCKARNRIGARGRQDSISGTDRSMVDPRPS